MTSWSIILTFCEVVSESINTIVFEGQREKKLTERREN